MFQVILYHEDLSFEQENSFSSSTSNISSSSDPIDTEKIHAESFGLITKAVKVVPALETLLKISLKSSEPSNKFQNMNTIKSNDHNNMEIDKDDNHGEKGNHKCNDHSKIKAEVGIVEQSIHRESESDFLTAALGRIILICEAVLLLNNRNQRMGFDFNLNSNDNVHSQNYLKQNTQINRNDMKNDSYNDIHWEGVHSILISANEGAGKTHLIDTLEKSIKNFKHKNQSINKTQACYFKGNIRVFRLSGSDCEYRNRGPSPSTSSSSSSDSPLSLNVSSKGYKDSNILLDKEYINIRFHLQWLIQLFAAEGEASSDTIYGNLFDDTGQDGLRVVLLIDDLDSILVSGLSDDDQGSNDNNDKESLSATAGYHLRQLLHAIAVPSNTCIDHIIIIGTTRVSPSALPRAHTGR